MCPRLARWLSMLVLLLVVPIERTRAADSTPGSLPPGSTASSPQLTQKLTAAWAARPAGYKPRTRFLRPDGSPLYTNRLFLESSPYLLQHAHNPVNWYPWGDEAFETARKLGRPVFLSVGYSTCHWCHVMEEESFEDEEIARYMNDNYIAVKVDREERPDVDAIYLSALQNLMGGGGWPMTMWLTPDRQPFFAGTYFPPRHRPGVSGLLSLLRSLREAYVTDPNSITSQASRITVGLQQSLAFKPGSGQPQAKAISRAANFYAMEFDAQDGGVSESPKFPSSLPLRFLLRYQRRTGDEQSLRMATLTLDKMAAGGMYDQIGGGFHRYSTDARWLVPHFEKMLYDNALLAMAYLEGYQATGRQNYAQVARDILRYVERDMTSPDGAFYSATDADSAGPGGAAEEGRYFTWTPSEIEGVVGAERAKLVSAYFGVTAAGNFHGRSVLSAGRSIEQVAAELNIPVEKARATLEESKGLLYRARAQRPIPLRDEKILTAWNGLMISVLSQAALTLGDERYAQRAARAADFALRNLRRDGRLVRTYSNGAAGRAAYLDDSAFFIAGLLDLYEASGELRWLTAALDLDRVVEQHYEDPAGGFYFTSDDSEKLLARHKPNFDGPEPSGNSVAILNLLRLAEFTSGERFRTRAERSLAAFNGMLTEQPVYLSEMLLAVDFALDSPKEIVIVTPKSRADAEPLLARLRQTLLPNRVLVVVSQPQVAATQKLIPLIEDKTARAGKATAYVCEKRVCQLPTSDPDTFARLIAKKSSGTPAPPAAATP